MIYTIEKGFFIMCREKGDQLGIKGIAEFYMCCYCQLELEDNLEYGEYLYDEYLYDWIKEQKK